MSAATCGRCGQLRQHHGRGLCKCCHGSHRRVPGTRRGPSRRGPVDVEVVDQVLAGLEPPAVLNAGELRAAVDMLTGRGHSAAEIARALGISARHVVRLRARNRDGA